MATGVVKKWFENGYGFIRRDGATDLFCHINDVADDVEELQSGQKVEFSEGTDDRTGKPVARAVRVV
jgi:cold shock CspA family protein